MAAPERPGWVTTIGVLGIILGAFGLYGGIQSFFMDRMLQEQLRVMQQAAADSAGRELPETFLKLFSGLLEDLSSRPPWFRKWAVAQGIATLFVYSGYLFASVGLLRLWPRSIACFYWASGTMIALTLVSSAVAIAAMPRLAVFALVGAAMTLGVNAILLGIVATRDKSVFRRIPPPLPPGATSA